jgi:hypothetical protein
MAACAAVNSGLVKPYRLFLNYFSAVIRFYARLV